MKNKNYSQAIATAMAIAKSNIRSRAQKHFMSYGWEFLSPMIYAVCYLMVKTAMVTHASPGGAHIDTALRTFVGVTLMQAWIQMLQQSSSFITKYRSLLRGMTISETPLILSLVLEQMFGLVIRLVMVVIAFLILGPGLPAFGVAWLWGLLALLCLMVSSLTIGMIIAPWAALYSDFSMAIRSATLPLMLLSPVFYKATQDPTHALFWLNCVNPMASVLATLTDVLFGFPPFYGFALIGWLVLGVCLLHFCKRNLRAQVPILLERLN
jgi:ABC-type polysaccharide/polyol phosphate export permease